MIGRTLLHYEITALLGEGGMGQVYRARDTKLDRDVALKLLPADVAADSGRLERFEREAKTVAGLNHPHIVHLYSVEEDQGVHFLTMELIEGKGLEQILTPDGLPLPKIFEIATAIADALATAHEKGVVHRDLKPANVMVTADGHVKVLDFGLAKLAADANASLESATAAMPITSEGSVLGTVPYMSPEQIRAQEVDHRSDIFSLGILLYELSTGRRPFAGATNSDISSSILRDTPPELTALKPDIPRQLGRIVAHCLEKEPKDRFHSAADIRNELRILRREIESSGSNADAAISGAYAGPTSDRRGRWIALAAILIVVAGVIVVLVRSDQPAQPQLTTQTHTANSNSIAVLAFADMSPDGDQEYFSDGIAEELLHLLAKIPELKVISRSSAFWYKGKDVPLKQIAEELGVAHILEGSVRKAGDRVRITAQLVNAADGFQLWSGSYDRTLEDIFAIQGQVAREVADALSMTLLPAQRESLSEMEFRNSDAHEAYLRGRFEWNKRTAPSLRRAIDFLERAIELDPDYAEAHAALAEAWAVLPDYSRSDLTEVKIRVELAVQKALELDPSLDYVRATLALIANYEWSWEEAEHEMELVIQANPNYASARQWYGWILLYCLRPDEAIAEIRAAREIDPLSAIINANVGMFLYVGGHYEEALGELDRCLKLHPSFWLAERFKALALLELGRHDEAISILRDRLEVSDDLTARSDMAFAYARAGERLEATRWLDLASEVAETEEDRLLLAAPYFALGDAEEAFSIWKQNCARRNPRASSMPLWLKVLELDRDPRHTEMLRCLKIPGYQ